MKKQSLLARFASYYSPYRLRFFQDVLMSTILTVCGLVYPMITRKIINVYVPQKMIREMIISIAAVLAVYLIKALAGYGVTYYGHMMGVDIQNDMQRDLFGTF